MALGTARKAVGKLLGPAGASTNGAEQQLYHDGGSTESTAHLLGYLLRADADCCSGGRAFLVPRTRAAPRRGMRCRGRCRRSHPGSRHRRLGGLHRRRLVPRPGGELGILAIGALEQQGAQRRSSSVRDCNVATVGPGPPGKPGQCAATQSGGGTRIGVTTGSGTGTGTGTSTGKFCGSVIGAHSDLRASERWRFGTFGCTRQSLLAVASGGGHFGDSAGRCGARQL
jgi:hypothetical protein